MWQYFSADSCLIAIQKFVARPGVPSSPESDRETCFWSRSEVEGFAKPLEVDRSADALLLETSSE